MTKKPKNLLTKFQLERIEREQEISNEYDSLLSEPGAMKTPVEEFLMRKYNIHSRSTIWLIRKRVAKRNETLQTA